MNSIYKRLLIVTVIILTGCSEANFILSNESRLPKWFDNEKVISGESYKVTMDYYIYSFTGRKAVFELYENDDFLYKSKVIGSMIGKEPFRLKNPSTGLTEKYPAYEVINVSGTIDIVEHRRMEPVFYMSDDPNVWKALGLNNRESKGNVVE